MAQAENTCEKYSYVLFLRAWVRAQVHTRSAVVLSGGFRLFTWITMIPALFEILDVSKRFQSDEQISRDWRDLSFENTTTNTDPFGSVVLACTIRNRDTSNVFCNDKDRRVHTESRSLRTLSPLESSQTVMIILYNRYNGNASYQRARVYGDDRGKGKGAWGKKKERKKESRIDS